MIKTAKNRKHPLILLVSPTNHCDPRVRGTPAVSGAPGDESIDPQLVSLPLRSLLSTSVAVERRMGRLLQVVLGFGFGFCVFSFALKGFWIKQKRACSQQRKSNVFLLPTAKRSFSKAQNISPDGQAKESHDKNCEGPSSSPLLFWSSCLWDREVLHRQFECPEHLEAPVLPKTYGKQQKFSSQKTWS